MARLSASNVVLEEARVGGSFSWAALVVSLRPGQWTKNLLVFAALIFGEKLFSPEALSRAIGAFLMFCALSGAVYLVNDVSDREADRRHPLKSRRPIAAGRLSAGTAMAWAVALGVTALAAGTWLRPALGLVGLGYLLLHALYTRALKHVVILDVLAIAIGFVLRAVAGGVAIDVPISDWLLVCTILLALFLALGKRRAEITLLADDATGHRRILEEYSPYLLDQMIGVVTASTLVAYMIYCLSPETTQHFGTHWLVLTVPFPIYGIFRYLYLVHRRDGGGSPAEMLLTDTPLLACVAMWGMAVIAIIYKPFGL
jgi:4-hydroxybenzoate polyprenyltransferase